MRRLLILLPLFLLLGATTQSHAEDCTQTKATGAEYARWVSIPDTSLPKATFTKAILDANRGIFDGPELRRYMGWISDHPACYTAEDVVRARMALG